VRPALVTALGLVAAAAAACAPATAPRVRALPVPLQAPEHHEEPGLAGVVHVVKRGETIYRIARAYGVDAADLAETNGIEDARAVAEGAELFVPGASRVVEVPNIGAPTPTPTPTSTSTATPRAAPSSARLSWPLKGVLYGRYGVRAGQRHDGIDIAAPEGAPVVAAADGTVIYAGEQAGYGAIVILKHDDGLVTLYAHNSRVLVQDGDRVRRGGPIARVGQTGRTTGPHLHFEVREGTRPRNPLLFLP
jgi:murein DD-endopeptidase MepM/ murein hydrolase activator NlpD